MISVSGGRGDFRGVEVSVGVSVGVSVEVSAWINPTLPRLISDSEIFLHPRVTKSQSHVKPPFFPSAFITSPHLPPPRLTSPHPSHLTSPVSPHLTSPCFTFPHLTSLHLASPYRPSWYNTRSITLVINVYICIDTWYVIHAVIRHYKDRIGRKWCHCWLCADSLHPSRSVSLTLRSEGMNYLSCCWEIKLETIKMLFAQNDCSV